MRRALLAGALADAALLGGAAGAGLYALSGGGEGATTTVREVVAPTASSASSAGPTLGQIYARAAPGVVEVAATGAGDPFGRASESQGSGFVVDAKGHVVTNQHVVDGADSIRVTFASGSTYRASLVGADAATDVAVLEVAAPPAALRPLGFADSSRVAVGDGVVAIGAPFGLEGTLTAGIVSAVGREIAGPDDTPIENAIQTDAAVNHGNSGGPLLDLRGRVIGITSQIESGSGGSDGVGFAVPSNTVKRVVAQLIASGSVRHARLGVEVETIPASAARALGVPAGVAVTSVEPGSAADAAGLEAATSSFTVDGESYPTGGDVVVGVDGKRVRTAQELRAAVAAHRPGDTIVLRVARDGETRTLRAALGSG